MILKLRVVLPVAVLGLALSGCSSEEPGKATPGDTPSATTASSPASSSSNSGSGIANVDPCSLLKAADVARLKLTAAEKVDANSCQWRTEDRTLVRLGTYATQGLKDYVLGPNSEPSDIKVGTHEAKLIKKTLSSFSCAVSIGLTATSRVDVNSSGPGLEGSCAASQSVAEAIEPNLP
ncbi:DUF3558 family protein [Streptomyces sp. ID05-26A]|nr:DUF3558 family protein [Streptomyces sp. ID05-26A]